ncbi:MAG: DUF1311 domain-containing protein [Anaerotignum sp.]|nr:DUF1311 domain-containing protein [Anaerotignum sp.]
MKKRMKSIIAILIMAVMCFSGCGKEPAVQDVPQTGYDVQAVLDEAETAASAIEKSLMEDASLTQMDMNDLSLELYQTWDGVLNDIWSELKVTLDEETMDDLLQEQREWIAEKETAAKQAGDEFAGGSMAPLAANQKAAELTRERVYELAPYLDAE